MKMFNFLKFVQYFFLYSVQSNVGQTSSKTKRKTLSTVDKKITTEATKRPSSSANINVRQLLIENSKLKRLIEFHRNKQLEQRRTILNLRRENTSLKKRLSLRSKLNVRDIQK